VNDLTKEEMLDLYKKMVFIRRVEEKLKEEFLQGNIPGFLHVSIGQEAVAAGICSNLRNDDYILSTHRGHGHVLAKGADLKKFMAEIYGRKNGYCKGRSGSMHVTATECGVLGCNGIVGAGISIATGVAFANMYKGTDQITVSFFGEGATSTGSFHEALNMASLWGLPILYCCETNGWAEFSPLSTHMRIKDVAERAKAYAMEAVIVDGDDVLAVYRMTKELIERIRRGGGPVLLECKTHRWEGHFVGDPQRYRPADSLKECQEHCPIEKLKDHLLALGLINEGIVEEIAEEIRKLVEEAVAFAKDSPLPAAEDLKEDVYCDV
jgi:pyruvate dehydrogenase E1 component alpha subunit